MSLLIAVVITLVGIVLAVGSIKLYVWLNQTNAGDWWEFFGGLLWAITIATSAGAIVLGVYAIIAVANGATIQQAFS